MKIEMMFRVECDGTNGFLNFVCEEEFDKIS